MSTKGKRKLPKVDIYSEDPGLIVDTPPDSDRDSPSGDEDEDTTDSEESEYSGLEEEEDSDGDESVESFEEASGSGEEGSGDEREAASETGEAGEGTSSPAKKSTETSGKGSTEQPASTQHDEYEYDSSDEEDIRNTVGNIPMEWYKEYEHIGYDLLGKKIGKPKSGGEIDDFLKKMDDPNYWRSVKDKTTGQDVVLADKDVEMIHRLRKGKYVDPNYNPYEPWVDFFTHEKMIHPVTNRPEHKRSFIPSKWEKLKVGRIVHAMKMGWIKPRQEKKEEEEEENFYMLWKDDDQSEINKRLRHHIPAPKMDLPGHSESYNPPPEYLFTEEEQLAWKMQDKEDRKLNYIPQKHKTLRSVPAYNRFINERFERCLDLYLCPRQRKMRMNVDPEDLIPKLPKPKDLQPFPTTQAMVYKGHTGLVRGVSVDPTGQWIVSASSDETVRFWEVATGRCMMTCELGGAVKTVSWNPNPSLCLVAAVVDDTVILINPALGDKLMSSNTDSVIQSYEDQETDTATKNKLQTLWEDYTDQEFTQGYRLKVKHPKPVSQVTWHGKGDYFAVVMPEGGNQSVMIHQLSKRRSQNPFSKPKGLVQCVLFHPVRPFLFVATQRYVRVYNLLKQELTKKLMTNVKWVSSMSVHPGGDNVIIGSYDCRLGWFDLDLSTKPYQMLRHHKKAVRQVCYHKKYPLFASASDDGTVIICHGMVYNDLLQNPLIVPVKILRGHEVSKGLGVLDCIFHPTQPWIFSCGADHTIRLFT